MDGSVTNEKVGEFAVAFDLDAVQAVLQLSTTKVPGADRLWFGLYGYVQIDRFAPMYMNNLLRDASHINLGHH